VTTRRAWLRLASAGGAFAACRPGPSDLPSGTDRWHPYAGGLADLLIVGGTIWTMDPDRPEVGAVAARGGRIIAIGEPGELTHLHGPRTRVLDLGGGFATPGLTDAHAHLFGLGAVLEEVDLRGATSPEEAVARVKQSAPPTGWIVGRGWDQNLWPGAAMPSHDLLTAAFPDRPVWLRRVDGHAGWANLAALKLAGVTATTPAPLGGEITLRDGPRGREPTGLLVDAAMELIPLPRPDADTLRQRILAAQDRVLPLGLTGVHEMGVSQDGHAALRALANSGELKLRITAYADEDWFVRQLRHNRPEKPGHDPRYALVGVKLYVDGALGSRGAALLAPYADRPGHTGALQHTPAQLRELVQTATRGRWQIAAHAIGDRAIRDLLDALETLPRDRSFEPRLRVEHAQIVDLADIPRFASLGAHRLPGASAWRRFLAAEVPLALGSDFPVEQPNPTHGLHAAITRQDAHAHPPGGWLPDQRLSLWQAVAGFTTGAAYAARQEHWCGRLSPGMAADITCFRDDLRELPPLALRDAPVLATVVGGRVAWE